MIIKSLLKDLMDTLPTDLFLLIDRHTSYVEETLLFNSSEYHEGIKPETWKCFLHHRHRKYDRFDQMFLYVDVKLEILKYTIKINDLIGFRLLFNMNKDGFRCKILLRLALFYDNKRFFLTIKPLAILELELTNDEIIEMILNYEAPTVLALYIDQIDLALVKSPSVITTIFESVKFNRTFISKMVSINPYLQDNCNKKELLNYVLHTCDNIPELLSVLQCDLEVINRAVFLVIMDCKLTKHIVSVFKSCNYDNIHETLIGFINRHCKKGYSFDSNIIKSFKCLMDNNIITETQLVQLYEYMLKILQSNQSFIDLFGLEEYLWITNLYVKHNPGLNLIQYNDMILNANFQYRDSNSKMIANYILDMYPQLPIDKYEKIPSGCSLSVYARLYLKDKIIFDDNKLLRLWGHGNYKAFKMINHKIDPTFRIRWAYNILSYYCLHYHKNLQQFIDLLSNLDVPINYQLLTEFVASGDLTRLPCKLPLDFWNNCLRYFNQDNVTKSLKLLTKNNKISDYQKLLTLSETKRHGKVSGCLSAIINSGFLYGYI